jgi:hypothetical protein
MPTLAEDQIAAVCSWLASSSQNASPPMGRDTIIRGPYATVVSVGIDSEDLPDCAADVEAGVLPLFTPQFSAAPIDVTPPENQPILLERVRHLLWKIEGGVDLPRLAVVALPTRQTSIRAALEAAGLSNLDLEQRGVLAVPLYAFAPADRWKISSRFPVA